MKRLEIGDEVYVRRVIDGCLFKAKYNDVSIMFLSFRKAYRIVYPFPCIKELAI